MEAEPRTRHWWGNAPQGTAPTEHVHVKAAAHNNCDDEALARMRSFSMGKLEMGRWVLTDRPWPPPKPELPARISLMPSGSLPALRTALDDAGPNAAQIAAAEARLLEYLDERLGKKKDRMRTSNAGRVSLAGDGSGRPQSKESREEVRPRG